MYLYYRAFSFIYDTLGGEITNEAKHEIMSLITFMGNIADDIHIITFIVSGSKFIV